MTRLTIQRLLSLRDTTNSKSFANDRFADIGYHKVFYDLVQRDGSHDPLFDVHLFHPLVQTLDGDGRTSIKK